ncbi:protein yellow-like [Myzus persicae]|uniref:protein yellow-like n=1 Tax=Myzus persicae TaxID=13164 RepID=UPI000B9300D8|nr:protein yellow-like [Myzus persicae]
MLSSKASIMILIETTIILLVEMWLAVAENYGTFLLSGSNLEWPSVAEESSDILFGRYEPRKILVHGFQMDNERAYVAMPRFMKTGVPWSLGVFRLDVMDFEPDIRPYPDYSNYGSCSAGRTSTCIVNVVDVFIENGVLWALDTGTINVLWKPLRQGPPQLISVNLTTHTVIGFTDLSAITWPNSVLEYVVAVRTSCGQLNVYVSDVGRHKIIVYDVDAGRLHSIQLPETIPVDSHRRAVLHLVPVGVAGRGYVYFTYRHSGYMFALDAWSRESVTHGAVSEVGVKPVGMHVLGSDRGTNVYFRTAGDGNGNDVWAWDVNRPLEVRSFVLVHRSYLYLTPTAVVAGWRNAVWTVESNYYEYTSGNVDCTGPRSLLRPLNGGAADDTNEVL